MNSILTKCILSLFLLIHISNVNGQEVTELVHSYKESYSKIFGTDGIIKMDLVKKFELGTNDTTYPFIIRISNIKTDVDIISYLGTGSSLANIGYSVNSQVKREFFELKPVELRSLYNCANEVLRYNESLKINNYDNASITECESSGVELKGEYDPSSSGKTIYYMEINNSVYEMKKKDFRNIMLNVKETLNYLKNKGELISDQGNK